MSDAIATPAAAAPVAPVAIVPAAPKKRRLVDKDVHVASFRYNTWSVDLDESQTLDDVMSEQFWAGAADKLMGQDKVNPKGVGDLIQIRKRDTSQFLEVIILAIGKGFIKVAALRAFEPKAVSEPDSAPLTTRWNPGKKCHEVIRKGDKTMMASNFQTKEQAVAWIVEHVKQMAA